MTKHKPEIEVINRKPENLRYETPLLFIHGTGHAAWCWDEYFMPYLAGKGFDCCAVSLRGHGKSGGHEGLRWTSVADYVSDVVDVVSQMPAKPVVIGHSLGGLVAQKYLEEHSAPAAVLIAPSPSEGMFRSAFWMPFQHPLLMMKISFYRDYSEMFSTPELAKKFLFSNDSDIKKIAGYVKRFGKESYRASLELLFNLPKVDRIRTRMLVLGAEGDALISKRAIDKTAADYGADCRIFAGMGHDLMIEDNWREVADFMADWLAENVP